MTHREPAGRSDVTKCPGVNKKPPTLADPKPQDHFHDWVDAILEAEKVPGLG